MTGLFHLAEQRAAYLGPGLPATVHAHHAVQICLPLSGPVRLRPGPGEPWQEYTAAAIPADCPHESDVAVEDIATIRLDRVPRETADWQMGHEHDEISPRAWSACRRGRRAAEPVAVARAVSRSDAGLRLLQPGFAALFTAAAIEPGSSERFVAIALGVYVVHGVTHVLRYYELYCGGGVPLNSRPQVLELRDGLELLAAATGLALLADALSRHSWPTPGVGAVRVASCRGRVVA